MTTPTAPPPDLRARVLAAARAEPAPPRARGLAQRALVLLLGFSATLAMLMHIGGTSRGSRPSGYFLAVTAAWLLVGVGAVWASVARGRSMLGRPVAWKRAVGLLTPVGLVLSALVAGLVWPETLGQPSEMRDHLVCVEFAVLMGLGPFVAFFLLARGSDPVAPRVTGMALGASAGAVGALCIDLACEHASMAHVVMGHVVPVLLLTLAGLALGERVLGVRRRAA
jgi:hypothetical protein